MSTIPAALESRTVRNRIFFGSALVLVAGLVAFGIVFLRDTGQTKDAPLTNKPAETAPNQKTVPLSAAARRVAGRFILTAVQRQHLAESWQLVGPQLKSGYTLASWVKGNIPVVPYLAPIGKTTIKVDISQPRYALVEALLLPRTADAKAQIFMLELRKYGERWLVNSWVPRGNYARPATLND